MKTNKNTNSMYALLLAFLFSVFSTEFYAQTDDHIISNDSLHQIDRDYNYSLSHFISKAGMFSLEIHDSCSYLGFNIRIPEDEFRIYLGDDDTFIMDLETGTRYKVRSARYGCKLGVTNVIKGMKDQWAHFQLVFPRLPRSVTRVMLYGLPAIELNGEYSFEVKDMEPVVSEKESGMYPELYDSPLAEYDREAPSIRRPRVVRGDNNFSLSDTSTWAVYADLQRVHPLGHEDMERHSIALWCLKDTTYVTQIVELKEKRTPFQYGFQDCIILCTDSVDIGDLNDQGFRLEHGLRPYEVMPCNADKPRKFFIEGMPGDFVMFVFKFPALKLGTDNLEIITPLFYSYDKHDDYNNIHYIPIDEKTVAEWRENRRYVKPYIDGQRLIVK